MIEKLTIAGALAAAPVAAQADEVAMTDTIYEIAIQEVKPGMDGAWADRRRRFLAELGDREGNERDWTFPAFFTFPEPGPNPDYVGITRWSQMSDFVAASEALIQTDMATSFFETVNMQAFIQARPLDGKPFVLEDMINTSGQVLEVAVRRPLAVNGPCQTCRPRNRVKRIFGIHFAHMVHHQDSNPGPFG